jgi:hypothetical protein
MRALIIGKLISRLSLERSNEIDADTAIAHPTHMSRHCSVVKQLKRYRFADAGDIGVNHHGPGLGDVADPDDMVAAFVVQHRRLEIAIDLEARLFALVEHAFDRPGDHAAIKAELARHVFISARRKFLSNRRNLKNGLQRINRAGQARYPLEAAVHPV